MSIITRQINSVAIAQRADDGFINLTKMAQASGKLIGHYLENKSTKAYLEALSADIGIPISALIQTRKGGSSIEQGSWGHPQVAIHCAQWCSPEFAVLVSKWVFEWMGLGKTPTTPNADRSLVGEINTLHAQLEATNERAKRDHLQLAKQIGDRLWIAKQQLKHGQWGKWLHNNFHHISERSLQGYMRISKYWQELQAVNAQTIRDANFFLRYRNTKRLQLLQPHSPEPTYDHPLIHLTLNLVKGGCHPDIAVKEAASVLVNEERITIRTEENTR